MIHLSAIGEGQVPDLTTLNRRSESVPMPTMELNRLVAELPLNERMRIRGSVDFTVNGLTHQFTAVRPGMVFFSLPESLEKNPYAAVRAAERGASAIVFSSGTILPPGRRTTCIQVSDPRVAYARSLALFHQVATANLRWVRVTGSRAASVAPILWQLIRNSGESAVLLSEAGCRLGPQGEREIPSAYSTLDAAQLWLALTHDVKRGVQWCVAEEPSRGPQIGHRSRSATSESMLHEFHVDAEYRTTMGSTQSLHHDGYHSQLLDLGLEQSRWEIEGIPTSRWARRSRCLVRTPLVGRRQSEDMLIAIASWMKLGFDVSKLNSAVARVRPIPGRLEPVEAGQNFRVWVDGSRTISSLAQTLRDLRELATKSSKRLRLLAGWGISMTEAERYSWMRLVMHGADEVWLTMDDPGPWSRMAWSRETEKMSFELSETGPVIIPDRAEAIRAWIRRADSSSLHVLVGKGHRRTQIGDSVVVPFDDVQHVRMALAERGYSGGEL